MFRLRNKVSIKRVLKFYFYADEYSRLIDWKISACAKNSVNRSGEECAEEMIELIEDKSILSEYWEYLEKVLAGFTNEEKKVLKFYCVLRAGVRRLGAAERAEIKRCAVKFRRRARRLDSFYEGYAVAAKYCCAI